MSAENQVYLLDAGNTHLKLALVQDGVIQWVERFSLTAFEVSKLHRNIPLACSSVLETALLQKVRAHFNAVFEITPLVNLPFLLAYKSPETLGTDRLCNAAALCKLAPNQPRLAIDLGTCIKFDFMSAAQEYLGGSISPGLSMRAKALHVFTAKLPDLAVCPSPALIGLDSKSSLQIGTYMGWQKEIEGFVQAYQDTYPEIQIYLTGGDAPYFDLGQKNGIFVLENLTLEGIFALYQANA